MQLSTRIISTLSVAALSLGAAAPALAYVSAPDGVDARALSIEAIRGDREMVTYGADRTEAQPLANGLSRLPVRGAWRQPGLRNRNRHLLGTQRRDGRYNNVRHYTQGDLRRRPRGQMHAVKSEDALLPPALVRTGGDMQRPTRREIRGNRDLNNHNRR